MFCQDRLRSSELSFAKTGSGLLFLSSCVRLPHVCHVRVSFRCVVLLRQVVINELEPDGWLTWLQNVKLDEQQARDTHTHTLQKQQQCYVTFCWIKHTSCFTQRTGCEI